MNESTGGAPLGNSWDEFAALRWAWAAAQLEASGRGREWLPDEVAASRLLEEFLVSEPQSVDSAPLRGLLFGLRNPFGNHELIANALVAASLRKPAARLICTGATRESVARKWYSPMLQWGINLGARVKCHPDVYSFTGQLTDMPPWSGLLRGARDDSGVVAGINLMTWRHLVSLFLEHGLDRSTDVCVIADDADYSLGDYGLKAFSLKSGMRCQYLNAPEPVRSRIDPLIAKRQLVGSIVQGLLTTGDKAISHPKPLWWEVVTAAAEDVWASLPVEEQSQYEGLDEFKRLLDTAVTAARLAERDIVVALHTVYGGVYSYRTRVRNVGALDDRELVLGDTNLTAAILVHFGARPDTVGDALMTTNEPATPGIRVLGHADKIALFSSEPKALEGVLSDRPVKAVTFGEGITETMREYLVRNTEVLPTREARLNRIVSVMKERRHNVFCLVSSTVPELKALADDLKERLPEGINDTNVVTVLDEPARPAFPSVTALADTIREAPSARRVILRSPDPGMEPFRVSRNGQGRAAVFLLDVSPEHAIAHLIQLVDVEGKSREVMPGDFHYLPTMDDYRLTDSDRIALENASSSDEKAMLLLKHE